MRNLKRALSLALAAVMVLGMMVVGAGAVSVDDFSDGEKIVNKEAVSVLTTLNVINGKEDGSYDPEGIVTRAEMAKMICVVLNGGRDPQLGAIVADTYTDTTTHWAKAFIEYCTNLGIVAGRGDGTFDPNGTVTVAEAAKMLLVAIGYNASLEGYVGGNWQINTDVKANQEDLYEGIAAVNTSEGLTRDNAAQMVYNALECQMVEYKYSVVTDGTTVTTKPQVTTEGLGNVLEEKFGAVKVEAIVRSNEYASLNNSYTSAEDKGETYLDVVAISNSKQINSSVPRDEDYKSADGIYEFSTSKDLLGQRVVLYVRYKDTVGYDEKDAVVIGSPIPVGKNKIVTSVDGTELADLLDDNKLEIGKNTEFYANYAGSYGEKTLMYGDFDGNKRADKDNTVSSMTQAEFAAYCELKGVTIRLIDNNGDKVVDYALAEKYSFGSVSKYDSNNEKFRIQGLFSEGDYKFEDVVGVDDVTKDDLVLFTEFGGKLYVQKAESFEGKLDAYSTSKKTVRVDAETYDWSGLYGTVESSFDMQRVGEYVKSDGILDTSASYYKDNNGYIIAVGEADESQFSYAVLLGFENQTRAGAGLGTSTRAKLLLSDGTTGTFDIATIGGNKVTNCTGNSISDGAPNNVKIPQGTEIGFRLTDLNKIYSYTKNEAGQMRLVEKTTNVANPSNTAIVLDSVKYERGKANIQFNINAADSKTSFDANYTVTENTTFLYLDNDGKTYRYVGRTAPSIQTSEDVTTALAGVNITVKTNGRNEALVVFVNRAPIDDFSDNFIFIYNKKVTENDKGYEVQGIKDGVIDTYVISSATNGGTSVIEEGWYDSNNDGKNDTYGHFIDEANLGLYNYSAEDDNTINIKKATSDYAAGTVQPAGASYIRVGNHSYLRTSDTKTFYARYGKTAETDVTVSIGDEAVLVFDKDDRILYVFVTKWGSDTDPDKKYPSELELKKNGDYTIDAFNPAGASVSDVLNAVAASLEDEGYSDVTVTSANPSAALGVAYGVIDAKKGIVTETFNVYHSAKLVVNGTELGLIHGNTAVTSKTATAPMILTKDDGTSYVYKSVSAKLTTNGSKEGTYTFGAADADKYGVITLVDAAQVNLTNATAALASDGTKAVADNDYIPVGTKIVVTGDNAAAGKTIVASKTSDSSYLTSGKTTTGATDKATLEYKMTEVGVTFAEVSGYTVHAGDDVTLTYTGVDGKTVTLEPGESGLVSSVVSDLKVETTDANAVIAVTAESDIKASAAATGTKGSAQALSAPGDETWVYAASKVTVDGSGTDYFKTGESITGTVAGVTSSAYKVSGESAKPVATTYTVGNTDVDFTSYNILTAAGATGNDLTVAVKSVTSATDSAKIESAGSDTWYVDATLSDVVVEYTVDGTENSTGSSGTKITVTGGGTIVKVGSNSDLAVTSPVATITEDATVTAAATGFKTGNLDLSSDVTVTLAVEDV